MIKNGIKKLTILKMLVAIVILVSIIFLVVSFINRDKDSNDKKNNKKVCINNPNKPVLDNGLVKVTIDSKGNVKKAGDDWYNYCDKNWANAVVLKDKNGELNEDNILAYYVWIPRYEYKNNLKDGNKNESEIDIKFIKGDKTKPSKGYIIPSAFKFGEQDLSGIWVAKFEPSMEGEDTGAIGALKCDPTRTFDSQKVRILPGQGSLRCISIGKAFDLTKQVGTAYNLAGDHHVIKNSEWAAVAYLSHSIYGRTSEIEISNNKYLTGSGTGKEFATKNTKKSTTGNVSGIYDMSGGSFEHVMGVYSEDGTNMITGSYGFTSIPETKYFDLLTDDRDEEKNISMATSETRGWYLDAKGFVDSQNPWLNRGGYFMSARSAGIFSYRSSNGLEDNHYSFRTVLTEVSK